MSKHIETLSNLDYISISARELLENRDEMKPKMVRTFNRPEAVEYLKCDYRTIDRYAKELEIDPKALKQHGIDWILDIEQIYQIRNALLETTILKKKFKYCNKDDEQCQVIVVHNQKGGVGKTISTINIAVGISIEYHQERRILVIDMDGQSTLSTYQPSINSEERSTVGDLIQLDPALEEYSNLIQASISDTTIPNLKIFPAAQADRDIEAIFHEGVFTGEIKSPYKRLASVLEIVKDQFEIILIDTPPSLGYASINAYFAATSIIFPLGANQNDTNATCQYLSYLPKLYKTLIKEGHTGYDFIKMLVTNYEESTSSLEVAGEIEHYFGDLVFNTYFKKSEAVRVCSLNRNSIFDLSASTYEGHKGTFKNARLNVISVVKDVMKEVTQVWARKRLEQ